MARVCFVCLGNICRSPTAAAVMRHHLARAGLEDRVEVDSAGTAAYHVGEPPDLRAQEEAARRGIHMEDRGRQVTREDLARFDLILAMDTENLANLERMAGPVHRDKVRLLRDFDPDAPTGADVPDPYYGGPDGFADVFDLVEAACVGLLDHLRETHDLG